jgi:hypothetical protein
VRAGSAGGRIARGVCLCRVQPRAVSGLPGARAVAAGWRHSAAVSQVGLGPWRAARIQDFEALHYAPHSRSRSSAQPRPTSAGAGAKRAELTAAAPHGGPAAPRTGGSSRGARPEPRDLAASSKTMAGVRAARWIPGERESQEPGGPRAALPGLHLQPSSPLRCIPSAAHVLLKAMGGYQASAHLALPVPPRCRATWAGRRQRPMGARAGQRALKRAACRLLLSAAHSASCRLSAKCSSQGAQCGPR